MTDIIKFEIRQGAYYDSIILMQLQRSLLDLNGVIDAGVIMATPANKALLEEGDLMPPDAAGAGPDDMLIVIKSDISEMAENALGEVDTLLQRRRAKVETRFRPRSLASAVKTQRDSRWVLISVPGRYAAGVAEEALDLSQNVFLYSDNVSLEDEIKLKKKAFEKGLLLMGPDCGTAIINGVGLGFANRVRRGKIGLVGASGTGIQAVTSKIHNMGAGISHAIGTGGRDLKAEVGGVTALQGLDLLSRDPDTKVIVLLSKPPEPTVASNILAAAQNAGKPVVVNFLGYVSTAQLLGNVYMTPNLFEAAHLAVDLLRHPKSINTKQLVMPVESLPLEGEKTSPKYLRGLFSGGTLAYETLLGLRSFITPLYSNIGTDSVFSLKNAAESEKHSILDLGEDEFTVGRLHPMIDNDLRIRRMRQEAADEEVGLILLDVVLGEGSHPDPASDLAPVIALIKESTNIQIAVILIGTDEDPQDRDSQASRLTLAGAKIFYNVVDAIEFVRQSYEPYLQVPKIVQPVPLDQFQGTLSAINVGLESFYESLVKQKAEAVHVDWRPPAGGNEKMMDILARLKGKK